MGHDADVPYAGYGIAYLFHLFLSFFSKAGYYGNNLAFAQVISQNYKSLTSHGLIVLFI